MSAQGRLIAPYIARTARRYSGDLASGFARQPREIHPIANPNPRNSAAVKISMRNPTTEA